MKNNTINSEKNLFASKSYSLKKRNLLLICVCIFALAGCTGRKSNNMSKLEENNKAFEVQESSDVFEVQESNGFIGVWECYTSGHNIFCCISSNDVGYIGNVQSGTHEMDVEEKNTYGYKIEGDTIYFENERFKRSFQLQGDDLIGDDGEKYHRSRTGITIYRESENGDSPHEFVETIQGTEKE